MRILFTAMANSIHTARWISQIAGQGWDIHVFDFQENSVNLELLNVTTHTFHPPPKQHDKLKTWKSDYPFRRGYGFARRNLPKILQRKLFPARVGKCVELIKKLKPDILHSLEMQHESYPLLEVKRELNEKFRMPWIYSSWGSDIYHFIKQLEHQGRIRQVLAECNYHIADCERDIRLAKENGFRGVTLGVFPTAGGYDINKLRALTLLRQTSERKTIAVKGYEHWAGRALTIIKALHLAADALKGFKVEIYLANEQVRKSAEEFSATKGIAVKFIDNAKNIEIIKLFARARISVGLSVSDGSPNTLLEAMIMGAFPIQSDTVSTAEWITNGKNGFLVPPEDAGATAKAIRRAICDNELVNYAAIVNEKLTLQRIDYSLIQPQIIDAYEKVYQQNRW